MPFPAKDINSCNIVVLGDPGTGKSTLALELASRLRLVDVDSEATRADRPGEASTVIYYSLEQSRRSLIERARFFSPVSAIYLRGPDVGFSPAQYSPSEFAGIIDAEIRNAWKQQFDEQRHTSGGRRVGVCVSRSNRISF